MLAACGSCRSWEWAHDTLPAATPLPHASAAASANAYLAQLSGLVCLHVLPDAAIKEGCNEEQDVFAREAMPLPGARALTLPQVGRGRGRGMRSSEGCIPRAGCRLRLWLAMCCA